MTDAIQDALDASTAERGHAFYSGLRKADLRTWLHSAPRWRTALDSAKAIDRPTYVMVRRVIEKCMSRGHADGAVVIAVLDDLCHQLAVLKAEQRERDAAPPEGACN